MANYKIATNGDVNTKMGTSLTPTDKCPTKSQLIAAGVSVAGSYGDNQLVRLDHVGKKTLKIASAEKNFTGTGQSSNQTINLTYDGDTSEHPLIVKVDTTQINWFGTSDAVDPYINSSNQLVYRIRKMMMSPYDFWDRTKYFDATWSPQVLTIGAETSPGSGVFDTDYCNTVTHKINGVWGGIGAPSGSSGSKMVPGQGTQGTYLYINNSYGGGSEAVGGVNSSNPVIAHSITSPWYTDTLNKFHFAVNSSNWIGNSASFPNCMLYSYYFPNGVPLYLTGSGGYMGSGWSEFDFRNLEGNSSIECSELVTSTYPVFTITMENDNREAGFVFQCQVRYSA